MAKEKPAPPVEKEAAASAGKKQAKASAPPPPKAPTVVEHYLGDKFSERVKDAFTVVEPILVAMMIGFCLSLMYPLYEEWTNWLAYFKTTPWVDAPDLRKLEGVYAPNDALLAAEHLFDGKIYGPESLVEYNGKLFASTLAGTVVEVPRSGTGDLKPIFFTTAAVEGLDETTGHPLYSWCQSQAAAKNLTAQHICGRPLGMRVRGDSLYVIDAYFGLFKKSLAAPGVAEWLVRPEDVEKPPAKAFDDLDVMADGSVVFTDASSVHPIRQFTSSIVNANGDGRLFLYNATTKAVQTLVKDLRFANGVQLTPSGDAVLFTESGRRRVHRCKLPVPLGEDCKPEILADNLPGIPDNLRPSADGKTVLVALAGKCAQPFCAIQLIMTRPQVARFVNAVVGKALFSTVEEAEEFVRKLHPRRVSCGIGKDIGSGTAEPEADAETLAVAPQRYGQVLQMTWEGAVVRTLHDATGRTPMISEAHGSPDGFIYLGSPTNAFLARVPAAVCNAPASEGGGEKREEL